jgi:hypothetical protein
MPSTNCDITSSLENDSTIKLLESLQIAVDGLVMDGQC